MKGLPMLEQWSSERTSLVAEVAPRARGVTVGRGRGAGRGGGRRVSAFAWSGDLIVTAAEAVAGADGVVVQSEHGDWPGKLLAVDLTTDIAVIEVRLAEGDRARAATGAAAAPGAGAATPPRLGPTVLAGEPVLVVGGHAGATVARWTSVQSVGPAWRSRRGGEIASRLEFAPGLSADLEGAGVFNVRGELIAMAVPGPRRRAIGIPSATLERVVGVVAQHGYLPRPFLGLRLQSLWLDESGRQRLRRAEDRVAVVAGVQEGSPAALAGMEVGDLLVAAAGESIGDARALARRLAGVNPGARLELEIRRGGESRQLIVTVGQAPAA